MKKLFLIISSLFLLTLSGCLNTDFQPDEWALDPELDFSNSTMIFNSALSTDSVSVFTNYSTFDAVSSASWCTVTTKPESSSINVNVEPNFDVSQRYAVITITISRGNKTLSKDISVVQMGGAWETVGIFNVYWGYEVSPTQRDAVIGLLNNMVYVNGGSFVMGNTSEDIVDSATPHDVNLSSYSIGKYEITQKEWLAIMGTDPAEFKGDNLPVYNISWSEALDFVTRLSKLTNLKVTLPTEAQWEFAAAGGNKNHGYQYSGSDDYSSVAVLNENQEPSAVGSKQSNELGLYDMSGNVSEYCSDWFEVRYEDPEKIDPTGPLSGTFKCVRGGNVSHASSLYYLRVTNRNQWSSSINNITSLTGLRIVIADE